MVWDPTKADLAASEFEQELCEMDDKIVDPFLALYLKYYMQAGHRRLGRVLVSRGKAVEEQGSKKSKKKAS